MKPITNTNIIEPFCHYFATDSSESTQQLNAWQTWAQSAEPGRGEYREIAVDRLAYALTHRTTSLNLSGLRLTQLPEPLPHFLHDLDISNNYLTCLPTTLPASLVTLDINYNQLTTLPATLPTSLIRLYASHNHLTCLPEKLPDSLEHLYVNYNQLTCLPVSLPVYLKKLDISHNQLTHLTSTLPLFLKHIYLSHNQLTCLPANLPDSLKLLEASHNQLTHLADNLPEAMAILEISHNQLTGLPANLPAFLEELRVNNNQLMCLPGTLPTALKELYINGNQLSSLPETLPASLQEIYVSHNRLTHLPESLPVSLGILNADRNQLTGLPAYLPVSLEVLNVSNNQLTSLPADLPSAINVIEISHNRLSQLPDTLPTSLDILCASYNQLTGLPETLPALEELDVSHNQLTALPENLPGIIELYASDNQLTRLPEILPDVMETLDVDNNPLSELFVLAERQATIMDSLSFGLPGFLAKIACWSDKTDSKPWEAIYTEEYADDFANFLQKLHEGKNRYNSALSERIVNWLTYLADDNRGELRKQTFILANETTESCVDRASFYFNHMYILMVEHQLLSPDVPLAKVVETIRGTFRLQILERLAAEKAAARRRVSPGFAEDLEIYLAYQCALREPLALPIYTELQFEQIAGITADDIDQAKQTVTAAEKADFWRYWLTESALWTAKLEGWNPAKKAEADNQYLEAISSPAFHAAVERALNEKNIPLSDNDAHRSISQIIADNLYNQQRYELTCELLTAHQAISLLESISPPFLPRASVIDRRGHYNHDENTLYSIDNALEDKR